MVEPIRTDPPGRCTSSRRARRVADTPPDADRWNRSTHVHDRTNDADDDARGAALGAVAALPDDPAQYEAMIASGAFKDHDRFRLINGYLVAKMTQNPPHVIADDLCGQRWPGYWPAGMSGRPSRSGSPARRACRSRTAVWCGGSTRDYGGASRAG